MLLFLCVLICSIFIFNLAANALSLYWIYPWLDNGMHFLGGMWVGLASVWFMYLSGYMRRPRLTGRIVLAVALGGGLFLGVLWELFEYGLGVAALFPEEYFSDTVLDLFMDTLGILTSFAYGFHRLRVSR